MAYHQTSTTFDRLMLASLAAAAVLTIYILHGSAGQYFHELGINFEYIWTVDASLLVGSAHALLAFFLIVGTTHFTRSVGPFSERRLYFVCLLNGAVVFLPVFALIQFTPGWNSAGFLSELLLYGAVVGVASYVQPIMRSPLFRTVDALKLEHTRNLATFQQLLWVSTILAGSVAIYYFTRFSDFIPAGLGNELAAVNVVAIHAVGCIYLVSSIVYLILSPVFSRICRVESEVEKTVLKSRSRKN